MKILSVMSAIFTYSMLTFSAFAVNGTKDVGANINFHGSLVNEPCTLQPGDESISLKFFTVIDSMLYKHQRTVSQPFALHLIGCNISDWGGDGTVTIKFTGEESAELTGYLLPSDPSLGIAIGIQTAAGGLLPLNDASKPMPLSDGANTLNFQAFIQGEPTELSNHTIKYGDFSAVATFYLEYQ